MFYKLKPIRYLNVDKETIEAKTATHHYTIRYDFEEKSYKVSYKELANNTIGFKYCKTLAECKEWIEQTHLPSKLKHFFEEVGA